MSTSETGSEAVGSSRTRTPSWAPSWSWRARAMATIVRSAGRRAATGVSGVAGIEKRSMISAVRRRCARQSILPPRPVLKPRPIAMFSATVSWPKTAGSWWTKCRPRVLASVTLQLSAAMLSPPISMAPPGSARYTPASTLTRVDLPEPLPPSRAWTCPRRTSSAASLSTRVPAKVLLMPEARRITSCAPPSRTVRRRPRSSCSSSRSPASACRTRRRCRRSRWSSSAASSRW